MNKYEILVLDEPTYKEIIEVPDELIEGKEYLVTSLAPQKFNAFQVLKKFV